MDSNYNYLCDRFDELGLGDCFNEQLRIQMSLGETKFLLRNQNEEGTRYQIVVTIKKWKDSSFYYIQKYLLTCYLTKANPVSRTFFLGTKGPAFKIDQALALLKGQSIYLENLFNDRNMASYSVWIKLDFNKMDGNGNYHTYFYNIKSEL